MPSLHGAVAPNELMTYDALGLTPPGKAHELVDRNDNTYGGKYIVNASGGLLAKGHPLGATGLGMAFYCCMQLRGWAGPMQDPRCVPGELEKQGKTAYTLLHNVGLGGSSVVAIFRRPDFYAATGEPDGRDRLGYNHGCECKRVSMAEYVSDFLFFPGSGSLPSLGREAGDKADVGIQTASTRSRARRPSPSGPRPPSEREMYKDSFLFRLAFPCRLSEPPSVPT